MENQNGDYWQSPRRLAEIEREMEQLERKSRYEIFDQFVDLALDGVVTLEQAFVAYVEMTEPKSA